jgi:hypothetical protein
MMRRRESRHHSIAPMKGSRIGELAARFDIVRFDAEA